MKLFTLKNIFLVLVLFPFLSLIASTDSSVAYRGGGEREGGGYGGSHGNENRQMERYNQDKASGKTDYVNPAHTNNYYHGNQGYNQGGGGTTVIQQPVYVNPNAPPPGQ